MDILYTFQYRHMHLHYICIAYFMKSVIRMIVIGLRFRGLSTVAPKIQNICTCQENNKYTKETKGSG